MLTIAHVLLVIGLASSPTTQTDVTADYYTAAVVDYAPGDNPQIDAETNIMTNVENYVAYIKNASLHEVDIIVFPEIGLIGYFNQVYYSEVPHADEAVTPCSVENYQSKAMVQLSCAAQKYNMYVVVNIPEIYYNVTANKTLHFNTNVAFDRNGKVVARYRKYNLFGEILTNTPELEHVFFNTDFGVKFGIFICFDMEFKDPPVTMVLDYDIHHFIFSTAWFSEIPFLTAIQAQWSFAYGFDVVLLASGYNDPLVGSTGSGIYQGRSGSKLYMMSESHGSTMLLATVQKKKNSFVSDKMAPMRKNTNYVQTKSDQTTTKLKVKQDAIKLYKTQLIFPPESCDDGSCIQDDPSNVSLTFSSVTEICHNSFCCLFNFTMTTIYDQAPTTNTTRGDDYNQLYYRLAVFNGVRTYSTFATGGLQVCSIIPCVDPTLESCGLRSDSEKAKPRMIKNKANGNFYQISTTFDHIEIHANIMDNNTSVYPDLLVRGNGDDFGSIVSSDAFTWQKMPSFNGTVHCELITLKHIENLNTFSIYARQFSRDGDPATTIDNSLSANFYPCLILLFILSLILVLKYN